MACAGYLLWNNTTVVYAEITNGLLVCSASAPLHPATCEESPAHAKENGASAVDAAANSNVLPLLAPKHMARSESPALPKLKRRLSQPQPEDEDDIECDGDDDDDDDGRQSYSSESDQSSSNCEGADGDAVRRVLRLCGHVVDVVDCDDERDDALPPVPFSFRVKTEQLTLHDDASFSTKPVDSLLLAAVDQNAKDEWMKRLARWKRYGWRETTEIAATAADCEALKVTVERWHDMVALTFSQSRDSCSYAHGMPSRSSRRRFYRSSVIGAVDDAMDGCDPWFHTRVIKTHI